MLKILISVPIIGILSMKLTEKREGWGRIQGMLYSIITLYISLYMLITMNNNNIEYKYRESIDLEYYKITLGIDGISISLIVLTTLLIPILILLKERKDREEENQIVRILLVLESFLIFLFSSLDFFVFFLLFELILIPMYILIGKYGSKEKRIEAAYRFIIYSLLGSLIMLLSIIILYIKYGTTNNEILMIKLFNDFDQSLLLKLLWLALFISFAIKVPIFPFHTWLPFVHVEAPTIGSMLLAGIMLKLGTYGLIRFNLNFFGDYNYYFFPLIFILALLSILYGSLTTIRQIDLKKIIAYSSIVHMNYAILGFFTNEIEGLTGANYMMISHAFVSCGLFLLVGILYKRYHSRIILYFNGLILTMPIFGTLFLLFTLANISLPLTSSFLSEILIIISTIKINLFVGILITFSLLFSTTYAIWLANRLLFGNLSSYLKFFLDLTKRELLAVLPLIIITLLLGINSKILLNLFSLPVLNLLN